MAKLFFTYEFDKNKQYGTIALVWNGWLPDGIYNISTRADDGGGVKSGVYNYRIGTHPIEGGESNRYYTDNGNAYKALNIYRSDVYMDDPNSRNIPAQDRPNGVDIYSGINAHAGNWMRLDENGNGVDRGNGISTGGEGCWTIPTVKGQENIGADYSQDNPGSWSYYQDAMSSFESGETGKAFLLRKGGVMDFLKSAISAGPAERPNNGGVLDIPSP